MNFNEEIPVIEEYLLLEKLEKSNNLREIIDSLMSRDYLPVEGRDYFTSEVAVVFGDHSVRWNAFRLAK